MEISSFETSAFNVRQLEKQDASKRSPLHFVRALVPVVALVGFLSLIGTLIASDSVATSPTAPLLTPSRLLVALTLVLIVITPLVKGSSSKPRVAPPALLSTRPTPAPVDTHAAPVPGLFSDAPASAIPRYSSQFVSGLAPVPSRFDSGMSASSSRRSSLGHHAPAPFVDDVHGSLKHEYTDQLPGWARKLEDLLVMRQIVFPLVKALDESDNVLSSVFQRFGFRLGHDAGARPETSVVYLADRFLPTPLCNEPGIVSEWQRRQMLESMVTLPDFPPHYREYVVGRIRAWASRSGIRFGYRHDHRIDAEGPTDSHILAHLLFASLEVQMGGTFKERYVVDGSRSGAAASLGDEFSVLFSSIGAKLGGGNHSRVVWLEHTSRKGAPLHFNVGTNQRVYGVQSGGGNLIEAFCLFFHLLKRLSPTANWLQIPSDVRSVVEASVGADNSSGLTGSFFAGLGGTAPALGY